MSENLYMLLVGILNSVLVIGACFFGMSDLVMAIICLAMVVVSVPMFAGSKASKQTQAKMA